MATESGGNGPAAGRGRYWLRRILMPAAALGVGLLMAGVTVVQYAYHHLDSNIRTDKQTEAMLGKDDKSRPKVADTPSDAPAHTENILLIGTDSRAGANSEYGRDDGGPARSDTTILLHLPADRKSATAMSIPRDLMVHIPACAKPDGSRTAPQFAQFNWAFERAGASCTIRTVEQMTNIRIDHYMSVDFTGFKDMVNAVGGVQVCLAEPVHDKDAKLNLPAGRQTLTGEQALGYVRVRKTIGDGSDTARMGRQQAFLASLVQKIDSDGVLLNPGKLYPLLDAATSSITVDSGLDSLSNLYDLARSVRSIPRDRVVFLTVPRTSWPVDPNRDTLVQPAADRLFAALRADRPVAVAAVPSPGASPSPGVSASPGASASPTPAFTGRAANADICA